MKNLFLMFAIASFSLTFSSPMVFAQNGANVSDDPDVDFQFVTTGSGKTGRNFPDPDALHSECWAQGDFTLAFQPTGEALGIRVFLEELYRNNYDGTYTKTVTRQVAFTVDDGVTYEIDFQMVDTLQVTAMGETIGNVTRTLNMHQKRIQGGSTTSINLGGTRDLQHATNIWIAAEEMNNVLGFQHSPELIEKVIVQATKQTLLNRDTCSGEVNYVLLKYLEFIQCGSQEACLQDMLSIERVMVPESCDYFRGQQIAQ
ncbi:hypothetical protein [Acanthopleuribacter pedis]|uniref:Secreted protein n=1 Tax=Acanthopleuribacter pedis TaxID=442870 RepID=A0A8J7U5E4_9BACT|nr:hypothetical protein [Acanthopleuribacter pedis]MBO1319236.1 hypothetical protein [Acanthopleuribacter pedis]